jgi:hypothetical protein
LRIFPGFFWNLLILFLKARKQASELLKEKIVEHANYEKANTNLAAAKEMVHLAEQSAISVRKLII